MPLTKNDKEIISSLKTRDEIQGTLLVMPASMLYKMEMSIYWEFPWVRWVPWDYYRNGNRQASFMEMGMGMA